MGAAKGGASTVILCMTTSLQTLARLVLRPDGHGERRYAVEVRAWKLTADGDYDLSTGQLVVVADGIALVQRLTLVLNIAWGEWFANYRLGVDYFGSVLGFQPDHVREEAFRRAILADVEVTDVFSISVTDDNSGTLDVDFSANSIYGTFDSGLGVSA